MDTDALVLFTDIRGFTTWADTPEVFASLGQFISRFLEIIHKHFPKPTYFAKGLGDGAMVIRLLNRPMDSQAAVDLLAETLHVVQQVAADFDRLRANFGQEVEHRDNLALGWGIVRGKVKKIKNDYVGPNVNKCARFCGDARPFGIIIDRDDFPILPTESGLEFLTQERIFKGIDKPVSVWVTKEIASQFVTREFLREAPEVHIAGMCLDDSDPRGLRLLLARRSERRSLYPGLIEGCGGQLARSETFADGVKRHFRLEMGLNLEVLEDIHCFYAIRLPDAPVIPGIRFLCPIQDDKSPKSENHSKVWWVGEKEFRRMPAAEFVGELKQEVIKLIDIFKRR